MLRTYFQARLTHLLKKTKTGEAINSDEIDDLVKHILENVDMKDIVYQLRLVLIFFIEIKVILPGHIVMPLLSYPRNEQLTKIGHV